MCGLHFFCWYIIPDWKDRSVFLSIRQSSHIATALAAPIICTSEVIRTYGTGRILSSLKRWHRFSRNIGPYMLVRVRFLRRLNGKHARRTIKRLSHHNMETKIPPKICHISFTNLEIVFLLLEVLHSRYYTWFTDKTCSKNHRSSKL